VSADALPPASQVIDQALSVANTAGCLVLVEDSSEAEVRFANNTATTNGTRRDRRVTVVALNDRAGGVATGVARRGGAVDVAALVQAAEAEAADTPPAADAAPLLPAGGDQAVPASAEGTGLSVLGGFVGGLAGAFARAEAAGVVLAGFAEHRVTSTFLGTSTGLRRSHRQPTGAVHLVGRDAHGRGSAWSGAGTADFADVSVEGLEDRVRRGLDWASHPVELDAGRYEVVLPPEAVADLMVAAVESMSGREAEEGRTVFSAPGGGTRVGEALSELPFDLWSDPHLPALSCAPFLATSVSTSDVSVFDNGLDLERTMWLRAGVLGRLLYHRAGAARAGQPVTAPVDNLVLELPGTQGDLDSMVASTERGLLLTCLWYIREVDPSTLLLTGLTRDGVYLVENGKVTGAVNNFRFNESPVDLLGRATEASASTRALGREFGEWYNRTAMPALRIPDFNMSSVSPAS
jgi:predicted Zn-dependent protease